MRSLARKRNFSGLTLIALALVAVIAIVGLATMQAGRMDEEPEFTSEFPFLKCDKFATIGFNPYWVLIPGYQLILEGEEDGESIRVEISVLWKTKNVRIPGIGRIRTRIIEEREWVDDELVEVSRNYFAINRRTNDVFYFGEDVDDYEDGEIVGHEGAWLAGEDGAMPGIIMPGSFLLGARYYQEVAPGVAMDRGENVATGLTVDTPAGEFDGCVEVLETTPLEPGEESVKMYAPGIGLIFDDDLELIDFGF